MAAPPGGEASADAAPASPARESVGASGSRGRNALTVTWSACGHDGGESSDEGSGLVISRAPSLVGRLAAADGLAAGPDVVLRSPKGLLDFEDLEFIRELGARALPRGLARQAPQARTPHRETGAASAREGQAHVRGSNVAP